MRRLLAAATLGALAAALLTGCGVQPAGTDGDLTDDWRAVPAAQPAVARVGDCHPMANPTSFLNSYQVLDCDRPHKAETVHVGQFTGADAKLPDPPGHGSPALRRPFADCDAKARQYVGGEWRGARMSVLVVSPSAAAWTAGDRTYRCDLYEVRDEDLWAGTDQLVVAWERKGSLRNTLTKPSPLAYTCFNLDLENYLEPVGCGQPHQLEYVGLWTSPDMAFDSLVDGQASRIHSRCRTLIARYVKVSEASLRTGTTFRTPSAGAWAQGDRGVRCFLHSGKVKLTRSVRGAGSGALSGR